MSSMVASTRGKGWAWAAAGKAAATNATKTGASIQKRFMCGLPRFECRNAQPANLGDAERRFVAGSQVGLAPKDGAGCQEWRPLSPGPSEVDHARQLATVASLEL